MRGTLGLAVFSGMLGVTLFGIFLTPVFFNVIDWLGTTRGFDSGPCVASFHHVGRFRVGFPLDASAALERRGTQRMAAQPRTAGLSGDTDNPK